MLTKADKDLEKMGDVEKYEYLVKEMTEELQRAIQIHLEGYDRNAFEGYNRKARINSLLDDIAYYKNELKKINKKNA